MLTQEFTHVPNFTDYMEIVFRIIQAGPPAQKVLDIPAGNGLFSARLRASGHHAVCADINRAGPDYVYADLNKPLPFAEHEFDTCVCMEGIEHVLNSFQLIAELCRITRPGGRIIISLPNIQNSYSRLNFLCAGYFFQFSPWASRHLQPGEEIDRGHIAPLSYLQLRYLFHYHGARLLSVGGDRWKKKWLIPFLLPFLGLGWIWSRRELARESEARQEEHRQALRHLFSAPALFSRSLILTFQVRHEVQASPPNH